MSCSFYTKHEDDPSILGRCNVPRTFLNDLRTLAGEGGGGGQTALFVNYTMLLVELEGHCSVTMTTPSQLTARRGNNALNQLFLEPRTQQ